MYKPLVALASLALLSGCAGTTQGTASAAEQCKMVDQDNTDSHIKVHQQCASPVEEGVTQDAHAG